MSSRRSLSRAVLATTALFAGCAYPTTETAPESKEITGVEDSPLYQGNNGNAKFNFELLNVCFESYAGDTTPTANEAALIRRAIENSWMRYSALTFTHWGACTAGEYGIH